MPVISHLFGVATVDDYIAFWSGRHLAARPRGRADAGRRQLAPRERVQVESIHIVVVDVVSSQGKGAHTELLQETTG